MNGGTDLRRIARASRIGQTSPRAKISDRATNCPEYKATAVQQIRLPA